MREGQGNRVWPHAEGRGLTSMKLALMYSEPSSPFGLRRARERLSRKQLSQHMETCAHTYIQGSLSG